MARPRAGLQAHERRLVGGDRAGWWVVPVDVDTIVSEVAGEQQPIVRNEVDRMRMGGFLPLRVRTFAGVLILRGGAKTSVTPDMKRHGAAAGVVRDGDRATAAIDREMTGICSPRRHLVQLSELPAGADRVGHDETRWLARRVGNADLGDSVEKSPIARDGHPRRIL